ncbi:MAG TPA: hypothetical protein VD884_05110 [Ohtaekwangia sp.]|nr:hypothetical protein [Ohtaekwangia sp.]
MITSSEHKSYGNANGETFVSGLYSDHKIDYPKFYKMDMQSRLGFLSAEFLFRDVPVKDYPSDSLSVVLSNADGSLDTDLKFDRSCQTAASPSLFVYTLSNIVAGEICIRHGIKGENAFFISASFDAELMCSYVDLTLSQPQTKACLAGWINVVEEQHDVLVYLVEKRQRGLCFEHTREQISKLYY